MSESISSETMTDKRKPDPVASGLNWGLRFFIMVMIPFLLAVGSARLVMTPAFLEFEYQRQGFPIDQYGFTLEDRLTYGPSGVLYIINNEPVEYLADLELPGHLCFPRSGRPCNAFNPLELSHMEDVQVVAQGLFGGAVIAAIVTVIAAIVLVRISGWRALRVAMIQGSSLTIGLIILIVLLAVTAWDMFFSGFHSLFFEDGTWQFYYSDTLIRLYPEQFWFDASLLVGGLTVGGALLILLLALRISQIKGGSD